ncbi:hypothetical protein SAMN07250955_105115 [Arboricoccus pini]|uniref:Secreted protein n=1 Tax=Arboricoccus pini TaxID=1963835 RepID=A0A212R3A8_9PROT|nr:hypothetical protein [Arboricoccus pini]SNB66480.1 hypothetical protein SAMN07250955_105115 [Arboricoccus pini]
MRSAMMVLTMLAFGLVACVGVRTDTVRQGAYAALSDYDAALAAADTYLCQNAGDFSAACTPKPDCTADAPAPAGGCVEASLRQAIQTTVKDADSYVTSARALVAQSTLSTEEESQLGSLTSLLSTVTATLRAQVLTAREATPATAAKED